MGFKALNTVLNPKRQCADWANQTLDSNFKRRPRGVSWQEKSFWPIKLLLCFWHHQRWKLMAKLLDKSFHVQKGFTSSSRGDDVHSHAISCPYCNCVPMFSMKCSNVHSHTTLLLATDLYNCHDNYCLLSIPISVHSIVPSFKTNSCCCCTRLWNEGSLVTKSKNWLAQHKFANMCMWD
jgi:hypothetical protein